MDHDLHCTILIDVLLSRGLIVFYSAVDGSLSAVPPLFPLALGRAEAASV